MNKLILSIALFLLLQLGLTSAVEANITLQQNSKAVDVDISKTIKALREIKTDSFDTTVPAAAKPLLPTLKHQLRDLITKTLDFHGSKPEEVGNVQKDLLRELTKQGIDLEKSGQMVYREDYVAKGYTYGDIYRISVEKLPLHPDVVAATTTIGVCCGDDTSFYLFRRNKGHWELIIAQESNDYDEVSGAQGRFRYAVSLPSETGRLYVVTANVTPWCSSNWQSLRYSVLREGPAPYQPKLLFKRTETVFLGDEDEGVITILPTGFRIEFDAEQALDMGGVMVRKHIAAYRVEGDQVLRGPPFAAGPEGFLDEWFSMPWEEALKWIEPSELINLRGWHQRLGSERLAKDHHFSASFIFDPPACEVEDGVWQIGIEFMPDSEQEVSPIGTPEDLYFTVVQKDGAFFLKNVSPTLSAPKCNPGKQ